MGCKVENGDKCCKVWVMSFRAEEATLITTTADPILINGKELVNVDTYTYLGLKMDVYLNMKSTVEHNFIKG